MAISFGNAVVFQPSMGQMINYATKLRPDVYINQITDLCSGTFVIAISLGEFFGPILSSQLLNNLSWSSSCLVMQLIIVAMTVYFYKV